MQDPSDGHNVKGGAIIHGTELPSSDHEELPLKNPPPEIPILKAEPSPPDQPQPSARDGAFEPKPPNEPDH